MRRAAGCRVVFLSNKPLEPRASYAAKLTRLGIPTPPEDVINSTQALIYLLQHEKRDARLFVIGEPSLVQEMSEAGFRVSSRPDCIDVVVAAFDRTLDYTKLNIAHQALVRGAAFYATNADLTCPVRGGEIPDCGGLIAFLEATSRRSLDVVAGKPSVHILAAALDRLRVDKMRCLMVGDRLETDMAMGTAAGMDTALVLTGVTTPEAVKQSAMQPTYILNSVAECP